MNLLTQMMALPHLTISEQTLVTFIVKQPTVVMNLRPQQLADAAFVSVSSIYRLINKLGLNGLGEFKLALLKTVQQTHPTATLDYDYPIVETDSPLQIMRQLETLYHQTLTDTHQFADEATINQVVQQLLGADVIDVYASAGNLHLAQNFKFQLQEIGVQVNVAEEGYQQELSAANATANHVALVVSYAGRGKTTQEVVRILQQNEVPIVLLTSTQPNSLSEAATHTLFLASNENHYNKISSFATRQSLLYLFDTIYACYFNAAYHENRAYKLATYQKMNPELT